MRYSLTLLSTAAMIAFALPLAAQDAPAEEPAEQTTPEAPAGEPADTPAEGPAPADGSDLTLDMGTETAGDGTPQPGQFYIREEFGDWGLRCIWVPEQPDPCELYQLLLGDEGNAVAEITIFPLADAGQAVAGATIVAPLETLLTERITLSVDGGPARQYEFSYCNRAGCIARIGLTAADVAAFKGGNAANLRIIPAAAPDQPFDLRISLRGFTAGFDGTGVYDPEAPDEVAPAEEAPAETPPAEGGN